MIYNFFRNSIKNHQHENIENYKEQYEIINEHCDDHDKEMTGEKFDTEKDHQNPMLNNLQEYIQKIIINK